MSRRARRGTAFAASDLPALAAFARGYLHQDARVEHGDLAGAAADFAADANATERQALISDVERLLAASAGWSDSRLTRFFHDDLGAAWPPASQEDLETILGVLTADPRDA